MSDYSTKSSLELKSLMKERNIPNRSMFKKKADMIQALLENDANPETFDGVVSKAYDAISISDLKKELAKRNIENHKCLHLKKIIWKVLTLHDEDPNHPEISKIINRILEVNKKKKEGKKDW